MQSNPPQGFWLEFDSVEREADHWFCGEHLDATGLAGYDFVQVLYSFCRDCDVVIATNACDLVDRTMIVYGAGY